MSAPCRLSATVGEAVALTYRLGCTGRLPKFYLLVRDALPPGVQFVGGPPPLVLSLWPEEEQIARSQIEARRRGVFSFGPARDLLDRPAGLADIHPEDAPGLRDDRLSCRPAPPRLLAARRGGAGLARVTSGALTRGAGDDFYGVREYGPGDELRRVHWRTTARTGTLAVTEYAQGLSAGSHPGAGPVAGAPIREPATTKAARWNAPSRWRRPWPMIFCAAGIRCTCWPPEGRRRTALPARSPEEMPRLLDILARVQADSSPLSLAQVLEEGGAGGSRTATLVTITPEAEDPASGGGSGRRGRRAAGSASGFALDARSFRAGQAGLPDSFGGAAVRVVRRGDDLQAASGKGRRWREW